MIDTHKSAPDNVGSENEAQTQSVGSAADNGGITGTKITLKPAGPLDPPGVHGRKTSPKRPLSRRNVVAYMAKIGVLAALSTVLYLFARFPIFAVFPFNVLDMDFSDVPALIGGFALGPVGGVII